MNRESLVEGYYMMTTGNPETRGMEIDLVNGTADVSIALLLSTMDENQAMIAQMLHATTATC